MNDIPECALSLIGKTLATLMRTELAAGCRSDHTSHIRLNAAGAGASFRVFHLGPAAPFKA